MSAVALSSRMLWTNQDGTLSREAVSLLQTLLNRTGGNVYSIAAGAVSFSPTGTITAENVQQLGAELDSDLTAHKADHANPHVVTKTQVGLGNADNTSDANKPVSTAQAAADAAVQAYAIDRSHHAGTQTSGSIALASGSIGYAVGNGGAVTQATSKATGVTLNKLSGDITLNAAALAASTVISFTLTNSNIAATDLVLACHNSAGTSGAYGVTAQVTSAGACLISVRNLTAGSLSEAIVIRFAVFKASTT